MYNSLVSMNYDFKSKWEIECMPLMRTDAIQKSIAKAVNGKNRNERIGGVDKQFLKKFKKYDFPLNYARGDGFYLADERRHLCIEEIELELIEWGILIKDKDAPADDASDDEWNYYDMSPEYYDYREKTMAPYVNAMREKHYDYYQMFHYCHWFNPTFGLTLAKMVMPKVDWVVRRGDRHTTVVSIDLTLVFDILYYDEEDDTFGGANSIEKSN